MNNILDHITSDEAFEILRILAESDQKIHEKIITIANELFEENSYEDIAGEVFGTLDDLDVHDLWNQAQKTSDGYRSTDEVAMEMIDEVLSPFQEKIFRLIKRGLKEEAKFYCMGVLKGLYMYYQDSKSEFKDWASDIPNDCFDNILGQWRKQTSKTSDLNEMQAFLKRECSNWGKA